MPKKRKTKNPAHMKPLPVCELELFPIRLGILIASLFPDELLRRVLKEKPKKKISLGYYLNDPFPYRPSKTSH
jgi:hypothetical protein